MEIDWLLKLKLVAFWFTAMVGSIVTFLLFVKYNRPNPPADSHDRSTRRGQ